MWLQRSRRTADNDGSRNSRATNTTLLMFVSFASYAVRIYQRNAYIDVLRLMCEKIFSILALNNTVNCVNEKAESCRCCLCLVFFLLLWSWTFLLSIVSYFGTYCWFTLWQSETLGILKRISFINIARVSVVYHEMVVKYEF